MSTITLPNIRVSSDLTVKLKLKDGGVAIDWSTLQNIKVGIHSDAQRAKAGNCGTTIDAEDPTILVCTYAANKPQYLGVNRVIVTAKYRGETKTYDKPAFNFVRWTDDQAGEQITIDDPDVDVEISVEDISSSILQEAVDEAFTAADRANDAAAAAEHMVDIHTGPEGKSAYEVAVEEGYTGTEEEWLASLKGPVGETPDISIGTVTTVEPGTPAAASMSGTPEAPVLNLSIPKGLVGATPNFTVGTVTTGEPGSSVIVTITGTPEAPVLNVTIPQGMRGNTGSSVDYPYELVNNLTTNDATKGLSAAQGYVLDGKVSQLEAKVANIDEALDVETTSEVVSERIPYVQNVGYINSGGAISISNPNYRYTDPILLKAGESLKMKAITGTAIARLCSYDPDTQTRTVLLMGASTSTSSAADAYENTYTATEDIYLVVCYMWNHYSLELTKTYTKVTTTSALDGIRVMEGILDIEHDTETITEDVPFTVILGKYYSGGVGQAVNVNSPSANQQYNCSSPFEVKAGETIEVKANGASTVALFAVQDGNNYRGIAVGEGIAVTTTVQYQVLFDTLAVVSYRAADGISVKKTYTKDEYDSARIKDLEDNLGRIPVLSGQVAALDGKVTIVQNAIGSSVDDDMTEGIVEGKFINNNGTIASNASFAYKEFVVRTGAVVKLVCSGHSNCASLAKKISETQYQVLVPGTSSSVDVTYTVTEDMTMAVSFYETYDRNIKIVTDYIEANRQSIKRLVDYNNDANIQDIDLGFLFDKIAVIGDSMSVGSIDGFPFSLGSAWLSFLAKRYGCTGKHFYAKGGTTTYMWLNDNTGFGLGSFLADETIYNCYFIAYGHNDSMSVGEITDTVAPVTITDGVPSCPSGLSFCSYYKAVIEQVRAKAPHAMIFCLSSYDDVMVTKDAFRQAIKGIADQYYNGGDELVHYLDTGGVGDSELNNGGHYSTIGYAYIAKKINTELNKVIYEHRGDDALKFFGAYNL